MIKSESQAIQNLVSDIWICADCSLERGYLWPDVGDVREKIGCCDYCSSRGVVFDKGDLVPAWKMEK